MTDAESSGQVLRIDIAPAVNVRADYSVCLVADGRAGEAATRFVEFMLSDTGQAVLLRWGFGVE
jgi:ABC-type molybdate transport system substrate-binding protein